MASFLALLIACTYMATSALLIVALACEEAKVPNGLIVCFYGVSFCVPKVPLEYPIIS